MKKVITMLLLLTLVIGMLSGCAGEKDNKGMDEAKSVGGEDTGGVNTDDAIDTSKEVKLTMYLLGDKAADFELVYDEINKILKEEVNASLEVKFLSWAEMDKKYSLLFSSGEDFDLIFTGTWAKYDETAIKKGLYAMEEQFVKTYAPDVWEVVPEEAWTQAKIEGTAYMVPNYQKEYAVDLIGVRGDLMEKYGMKEITSEEDLEAYYDAIVENETDISPLANKGGALQYPYQFQSRGWAKVNGTPGELFLYESANTGNMDIAYALETPEFLEYAKKMKEMYDKGYWSSDSLSTTDTREDNWKQGKSASMVWNMASLTQIAREINAANPEWKATFVDIAPEIPKEINPYTNNGIAINANSKNTERAMMVINELMTNKEVYDLASLGIEGVHYTAVGENQYSPIEEGAQRFPANGSCNWGWTNMDIRRELYVEEPDEVYLLQQATLEKWNSQTTEQHIYSTFSFNEESVKTEAAIVNTLITQYMIPINMGMVEDVEAAVDELKEKLEEAGIQKIYEELQKQADEFAKAVQ